MSKNKLTRPQLNFLLKFYEQIDHIQNLFYKGLRNLVKSEKFTSKFPKLICYKDKKFNEEKNETLYSLFDNDFQKEIRKELSERDQNREPNSDEILFMKNWENVSFFLENKKIFWKICCLGFESISKLKNYGDDLLEYKNLEEFCQKIEKLFERLNWNTLQIKINGFKLKLSSLNINSKEKDQILSEFADIERMFLQESETLRQEVIYLRSKLSDSEKNPEINFFENVSNNIEYLQKYYIKGIQNLLENQSFHKKFPELRYYNKIKIEKIKCQNFDDQILSSHPLEYQTQERTENKGLMDIYKKHKEIFTFIWENRKKIKRICKYGFDKIFKEAVSVISDHSNLSLHEKKSQENDESIEKELDDLELVEFCRKLDSFFEIVSKPSGKEEFESQAIKNDESMPIQGKESFEKYEESNAVVGDKDEIRRLKEIIKKKEEECQKRKEDILKLRGELRSSEMKYEELKSSLEKKLKL